MQSLYGACNKITDNGLSGTENIGGYDIFIERFTQNDLLTDGYSLGDTNQDNIVLVTDSVIQIPEGQTLTCTSPKKSLVIMCDTLINNGTISMVAKGPNILPHDYLLLGDDDGFNDIIVPAYGTAPSRRHTDSTGWSYYGAKGVDGQSRQCGSGGYGGTGRKYGSTSTYYSTPGSSYAFGGGAGSGGVFTYGWSGPWNYNPKSNVNTTYPMRGGDGDPNSGGEDDECGGGVGIPAGRNKTAGNHDNNYYSRQNTGVGGRVIVFCNKFINNGTITVDGTNANASNARYAMRSIGGPSGAGAVDIFYNTFNNANKDEGTITATGGKGANGTVYGGNGSITLTPMNLPSMVKPGYLGVNGLTKLITLIRDETASAKGDYLETDTIKLTKDGNDITADAKISEEENNIIETKEDGLYVKDIEISQEQDNGLYRLDDGLYVRFASFTDDEIFNIVRLMQSNSIDTNVTTADFYAILTKEGYIVKLKEDSDG